MLSFAGSTVSRFLAVGGALALLVAVPACSSGPKRPSTIKVSGKVTMNGTPVPGATVSFQPVAAGGRAAVGITDDAGKYVLTSFEAGDGAVAGDYGVAIVKNETAAATGSSANANSDDYVPPEGLKEPPPAKSLIPPRFNSPRESGLRATVGGGSTTFDFELAK
jgi:hypothetical protein